jgi:hypothetical protein|uniref:Glycine-rich protein n=1 Tax=Picea glauca TaxID=3330 RepID=A0A101M526_PICGL|nr:hypothetical protein ABT39_MTgene878 [Picea glauca]QHR89363.1 hypothetical protein Q903MT_gene3384 [Picea sitchensis]
MLLGVPNLTRLLGGLLFWYALSAGSPYSHNVPGLLGVPIQPRYLSISSGEGYKASYLGSVGVSGLKGQPGFKLEGYTYNHFVSILVRAGENGKR